MREHKKQNHARAAVSNRTVLEIKIISSACTATEERNAAGDNKIQPNFKTKEKEQKISVKNYAGIAA